MKTKNKGGEIRGTKPLNLSRNVVSRISPCVINLSRNEYFCCGLKKVVAKSRVRVYFEQQNLALLLVFHETRNLSWMHTKQNNQSARCISSTRNKCFLLCVQTLYQYSDHIICSMSSLSVLFFFTNEHNLSMVLHFYYKGILEKATMQRTRLNFILVPRCRAPFGQHQESRPLARSNDIPVLNGFVNTID